MRVTRTTKPTAAALLAALGVLGAAIAACSDGSGDVSDGSGATGPGSSSASGTSAASGTPVACGSESPHTGDGTVYDADGTGNCSFDAAPDRMVGAMNHADYAASAVCGECVAISGPSGDVTIRIVDQCPECAPGDIDLSAEAFAKIAEPSAGRVSISWKVVSCGLPGPIRYRFKEGSNPYWTAVQIRNANSAILSVEAMKDGAYEPLTRTDYDYFLDESGLGPGPYSFRVTDVYGDVPHDAEIPFGEAQTFDGAAQFPPCP
jgi:expansin (peptidoglycan-binding protein)